MAYLSEARAKNRRALEGAKMDYADMRFRQGEQRFLNMVIDGHIKELVENYVTAANNKSK